jgi:uncharacterized membrane protein YeaQ/YmgE (transglycosylase-associated protein family)
VVFEPDQIFSHSASGVPDWRLYCSAECPLPHIEAYANKKLGFLSLDSLRYISVGSLTAAPRRIVMGFLAWIVVGLIAGWLAGQVMKGGGYGILVDIILGILGGFLGGWVFGLLGIWPGGGMIGSIIVAFVGAVILVGITRLLKKA